MHCVWHVVVAPFMDDGSIMEKYQSGLGSYYSLEHAVIGEEIVIFCSSVFCPVFLIGYRCGGCEAVEWNFLRHGEVVGLVDVVYASFISIEQVWDDEEE